MTNRLSEEVADLIRAVAAREIAPRYRALHAHEIEEKGPGDLVTAADHAVEAALADGLLALVPEALFVGEERCARAPELLDRLGEGLVWVVDPVDGTGNFAAGRAPFAVMVALLRDGITIASWIHDPLSGRMMVAERGGGAWCDGQRLDSAAAARADPAELAGIVSSFAMPEAKRDAVAALTAGVAEIVPTLRCAGHEYPLVALGERDFALYWRTLVWDHAAGALLLEEAGGVVERLDGTTYRPGSTETGILLARSRAVADAVHLLLRRGQAAR
ncbi:inositol monophosphatase family protein [Sphingosinithalassobacter sp. LHW66-3]|uniref:inositol monophosphatase family protein n=1 Tax=Sphingosinithalassobacter sp. LHW66-3 TaxID=3424718 RepID=UPI003D6AE4F9